MALEVKDIPIPQDFVGDSSVTDPACVLKAVGSCNLYGLDGVVWSNFRWPNKLSPDQQRAALLNKAKLSREQLACLLFDVLMQHMKRQKLIYTYTAGGGGLFGADPLDKQINCKDCATSFASLLFAFGYNPQGSFFWNQSNPSDNPAIKVMAQPAYEVSASDVQGYHSSDLVVKYDEATMAAVPLEGDLSNAFHVRLTTAGTAAVIMCDRDPFLNHFVLKVDGQGFQFPYFDPLTGRRYKNGQADFFAAYERTPAAALRYRCGNNEPVDVFLRQDQPKARLYAVPASMSFRDATFQAVKMKYQEQGVFLVIDPADWSQAASQPATRQRANADAFSHAPSPALIGRHRAGAVTSPSYPHPACIQHLYG